MNLKRDIDNIIKELSNNRAPGLNPNKHICNIIDPDNTNLKEILDLLDHPEVRDKFKKVTAFDVAWDRERGTYSCPGIGYMDPIGKLVNPLETFYVNLKIKHMQFAKEFYEENCPETINVLKDRINKLSDDLQDLKNQIKFGPSIDDMKKDIANIKEAIDYSEKKMKPIVLQQDLSNAIEALNMPSQYVRLLKPANLFLCNIHNEYAKYQFNIDEVLKALTRKDVLAELKKRDWI